LERHFLLVCFYGSAKEQSNYAHGLAQNPSLGNPPFCASVCGKKGATVTQQSTPNLAADVSATGNRGEWRCMVWQRGEYKYRVTKQLEPNLLLTSKQKFRFGQVWLKLLGHPVVEKAKFQMQRVLPFLYRPFHEGKSYSRFIVG